MASIAHNIAASEREPIDELETVSNWVASLVSILDLIHTSLATGVANNTDLSALAGAMSLGEHANAKLSETISFLMIERHQHEAARVKLAA